MKIAQVVHLFPPATGGIEHHTFELCKDLAKAGNQVTVFTTKVPYAPDEETLKGFKVRRFFSLNFPLFSSVRWVPFMALRLMLEDADIYCSHGYGSLMPLCASIAALARGKPFVFTLHGYPKLNGLSGFFQGLYRVFAASIYLRIAKKVIVVSRASINEVKGEVDAKKIVYVPNGISADEFSCPPYSEKSGIAYIGRLDKYKGIDTLLKAYAKIREKYPNLKLSIVGRDEGIGKELEALAKELKIEPEFVDVPYSDIKKVYCESKAIVLPSKYEGFSLVWLEAMASARPMFSTPVGDASHLFEQAYGNDAPKFLFNDENELSQKLLAFLANEKAYEKAVKRAEYTCKEEYSWENVALLTQKVYEEASGFAPEKAKE